MAKQLTPEPTANTVALCSTIIPISRTPGADSYPEPLPDHNCHVGREKFEAMSHVLSLLYCSKQ